MVEAWDVEAKLNTVNMMAWVHKECDSIQTGALTKLQEVWDSSEQKDECISLAVARGPDVPPPPPRSSASLPVPDQCT